MFALIVDDAELNNVIMIEALRGVPDCMPRDFTNAIEAIAFLRGRPDEIGIAIVDYEMPEMNGLEFIRAARATPGFAHVPIVMVTSVNQRSLRREALSSGATDFLTKPFDAIEINVRVANLLALNAARRDEADRAAILAREVKTAVSLIEQREREIVNRLIRATEHRDTDTGAHVSRVAMYVSAIAKRLGFDIDRCDLLALASTMHDVGKVAVPDSILLKPGPLTPEERSEIIRHAEHGHAILAGSSSEVIQLAAEIALTHHERWDGQGYPRGLSGTDIPMSGRIVAVADVYDALISDRPYKKAWSIETAQEYLTANAGTQFDPACVKAFLARERDGTTRSMCPVLLKAS